MKIKVNEKCSCGSGLKHKKCFCHLVSDKIAEISSEESIKDMEKLLSSMDGYSCFPYLKEKSKKLIPVLEKYNFNDLVKSIFCVNSWRDNRSTLESGLALNECLRNLIYKKSGTKTINTYDEFCGFFNAISAMLPITIGDDCTCSDFGEVKIRFENKFYPVLIGTGNSDVFSALQFLPQLSKILEKDDLTIECLNYHAMIINSLSESNVSKYEYDDVRFDIPSKQHFETITELFSSNYMFDVSNELFELLNSSDISRCHFIKLDDKFYPLFNATFVIDYYSCLLQLADDKQIFEHVEWALCKKAHEIFNTKVEGNSKVLLFATVIEDNKSSTLHPLTFVALANEGIVIAINSDKYTGTELQDELDKIRKLHEQKELIIAETILNKEKNGYLNIKVPSAQKIYFILYNQHTDITRSSFMARNNEVVDIKCNAVDLMFLICFIENLEEFCEFIEYQKTKVERAQTIGGLSNIFCAWKQSEKLVVKGAVPVDFLYIHYENATDYVFEYFKNTLSEYPYNTDSWLFSEPMSWNIKCSDNRVSYGSKSESVFCGDGIKLENDAFLFFCHNYSLHDVKNIDNQQITWLKTLNGLNQSLFQGYRNLLSKIPSLENQCLQFLFLPLEYAKKTDNTEFINEHSRKYVYSEINGCRKGTQIRYSVNFETLIDDISESTDKSVETQYFLELIHPLYEKHPKEYEILINQAKADSDSKKTVAVVGVEMDFYASKNNTPFELDTTSLHLVRKRIAEICYACEIKSGTYQRREATKIIRTMQEVLVKEFESEIAKYDMLDLHSRTLSCYSTALIDVYIHSARLNEEPRRRAAGYLVQSPTLSLRRDVVDCILSLDFAHNSLSSARCHVYQPC